MIQVTVDAIKRDLEDGLTRKKLAEKYNVSTGAISKAMKRAGLGGMKAKSPSIIICDTSMGECITEPNPSVQQEQQNTQAGS